MYECAIHKNTLKFLNVLVCWDSKLQSCYYVIFIYIVSKTKPKYAFIPCIWMTKSGSSWYSSKIDYEYELTLSTSLCFEASLGKKYACISAIVRNGSATLSLQVWSSCSE